MTRIIQDAPPYMILEGHPSRVRGVNVIGLQRGGFSEPEIEACARRSGSSGAPEIRAAARSRISRPAQAGRGCCAPRRKPPEHGKGREGPYRESLRDQFQRAGVQRVLRRARDFMTSADRGDLEEVDSA